MRLLHASLLLPLLGAALAAHASPLLIDDFSTPSFTPIVLTNVGDSAEANDVANSPFVVFGTIGAALTSTTDAGRNQRLTLGIDNGTLDYSSDARVDGTFRTRYDFGNADFQNNRSFRLDFAFLEHDLPYSVTLFGSDLVTPDGQTSVVSGIIPAGSATYDITGFKLDDIVFHHIFLAEFRFDPPKAGDVSLDSIEAVPEPASLAGLGLGALALLRRRK